MNGMKYLKLHSVKNPNILRYYNQYAGAKISELKKGVQFELDQYKNPKGKWSLHFKHSYSHLRH